MSVNAEYYDDFLALNDVSVEAQLVRQALLEKGLETPMIPNGLTRDEKYDRIKAAMTDVVTTLGLSLIHI